MARESRAKDSRRNATDNVSVLFTMDQVRFAEYESRLKPMAEEAKELRRALNTREAMESAGRGRFLAGALVLLSAMSAAISLSLYDEKAMFAVIASGTVGLWLAAMGIRNHLAGREIRRRAASALRALEGSEGFLWRFEPLLRGWDIAPPAQVAESLRLICQHSKEGEIDEDHYTLRAYWYWVNVLSGRFDSMHVVEGESRR